MSRKGWTFGIGCAVVGLLVGAMLTPTQGAQVAGSAGRLQESSYGGITQEGALRPGLSVPVEVVNFPDPQNVVGEVNVANLPVDEAGNVRVVGGQDVGSETVELRFFESNRIGRFLPTIPLPSGFKRVSVTVQIVDTTVAVWGSGNSFELQFGSDTAPMMHTEDGDREMFWPPDSGRVGGNSRTVAGSRVLFVEGNLLRIEPKTVDAETRTDPTPPETEYYVHLYLTK